MIFNYDVSEILSEIDGYFPKTRIADANDMEIGKPVLGFVSNSTVNVPIAASGAIWHYASSANYATQLLQYVGDNGLWRRTKSNGTWSSWQPLDGYRSGSSVSLTIRVPGRITDGSHMLVGIPLDKPVLVAASNVSIKVTSNINVSALTGGTATGGLSSTAVTASAVSGNVVSAAIATNNSGLAANACYLVEANVTITFT